MFFKNLIKIVFGLSFWFACFAVAHADFRVCNASQEMVGVAIGYRAPQGWVSEGWWRIGPTRCETLLEGALTSRFYYLHAEDSKITGYWDGPIDMCLKDSEFIIEGVQDCFARGFQKAGFQEVDTGVQNSWTVQLTEPTFSNSTEKLPQ